MEYFCKNNNGKCMEMKTFREKEKVACMPIYIFVCVTGGNDLHYINSSNAVRIVRGGIPLKHLECLCYKTTVGSTCK